MKKLILLLLSVQAAYSHATVTMGSVMFAGGESFNFLDNMNFAILQPIQAGEVVFITDNAPNAVGDGFIGIEGYLQWDIDMDIPAGTVMGFGGLQSLSPSVDVGTIARVEGSFNFNPGPGDEVYLYQTDDNAFGGSVNSWITGFAIGKSVANTFPATGLTLGVDALEEPSGGYNATEFALSHESPVDTPAGWAAQLSEPTNFSFGTFGNDKTPFALVPEPSSSLMLLLAVAHLGVFRRRRD